MVMMELTLIRRVTRNHSQRARAKLKLKVRRRTVGQDVRSLPTKRQTVEMVIRMRVATRINSSRSHRSRDNAHQEDHACHEMTVT